jgi:ATP-dependent DNA helicase RecQ
MCEYARRGIESIKQGLQLVLAYFQLPRAEFLGDYFADRQETLQRAIAHESYQQIVDDLRHPTQQAVVAALPDDNLLILAGPGSGKTRVVVHRVAYLVRVQRVPAQQILVLCFNRLAAVQLKRRLHELIGPSAAYVTVLTYHALAARLTGASFAQRAASDVDQPLELADLIPAAVRILRGQQPVPGVESDQVRERLLAGYRYVLVDEYQDIDQQQYDLISALTDRTGRTRTRRLSILAVGDDDQNIYTFRGANVEFIRRFQTDYQGTCPLPAGKLPLDRPYHQRRQPADRRQLRPHEDRPRDPHQRRSAIRSARRRLGADRSDRARPSPGAAPGRAGTRPR